MINIQLETVVSLSDAANLPQLPRRRCGKRIHSSTIFRWCQKGIRGVRLETIRVGGTLCTSIEAIQRFCNRLTHDAPGSREHSSIHDTSAADNAGRALDSLNI